MGGRGWRGGCGGGKKKWEKKGEGGVNGGGGGGGKGEGVERGRRGGGWGGRRIFMLGSDTNLPAKTMRRPQPVRARDREHDGEHRKRGMPQRAVDIRDRSRRSGTASARSKYSSCSSISSSLAPIEAGGLWVRQIFSRTP